MALKLKQKSIFRSWTFWSVLGLFIEGIKPLILSHVSDGFSVSIGLEYLVFLVGFVSANMGRYNADSKLYTPKFFPGRDKQSYSQLVKGGGDR